MHILCTFNYDYYVHVTMFCKLLGVFGCVGRGWMFKMRDKKIPLCRRRGRTCERFDFSSTFHIHSTIHRDHRDLYSISMIHASKAPRPSSSSRSNHSLENTKCSSGSLAPTWTSSFETTRRRTGYRFTETRCFSVTKSSASCLKIRVQMGRVCNSDWAKTRVQGSYIYWFCYQQKPDLSFNSCYVF